MGFRIQDIRFKIQIALASLVFLLGIIIVHPFSSPNPDGKLHLDFLDVGQGDSALVTMPTGETILIDGGGRASFNKLYVQRDGEEPELFEPDVQNIGETVVSNFLWEKGYDNLDYLLATHADTDHIQGLTDVAGNFAVKLAFVARTPSKDTDFDDFTKILEKKDIPIAKIGRGDLLTFGDAKVEILYPNPDENPDAKWDNNHGIVLRIVYGETTFLLTADIEKEAEKVLLQMPELLQSNVVKVAHHGSKTSSIQPFIEAKLAIISIGKKSPFGHPHQEVVERWKKSEAKIMTTSEKGTVTIISDGKSISLQTFVK
jgi:competence protein ComEC